MKKEILRMAISYLLSFVSSLCLTVAILLLAVTVVLSRPFTHAVIERCNYEELAHREIVESLESLAIPGGLPDDFFAAGLDKELLKSDIERGVDTAYSGVPFEHSEFSSVLRERIEQYARDTETDPENETVAAAITQLMAYFDSVYRASVSTGAMRFLASGFNLLFPWGIVGIFVLAALAALFMAVVKKMNEEYSGHYFSGFLGGAALMLAALPAAVLLSGRVAKLGISSPPTFALMSSVIYAFLWGLITAAAVLIAATIVMAIIKKVSSKR